MRWLRTIRSLAPLAPDVEYAQDNVRLKIGQALWATATARGKYIHYFADPEQGDVGVITVIYENGVGAILIVRLKVRWADSSRKPNSSSRTIPVARPTTKKLASPIRDG